MNILLVEDSPINAHLVELMLANLGHENVTLAETGTSAVQATHETAYELILLDLELPEMNGVDVARHIRQSENSTLNRDTPIVAMTAFDAPDIRGNCRDAGMDDFVVKPIKKQTLQDILLRVEAAAQGARPYSGQTAEGIVRDQTEIMHQLGGQDTYALLWSMFTQEAPHLLDLISKAVNDENNGSCVQYVHQLKSLCKIVGGVSCVTSCDTLLKAAEYNGFSGATAALDLLRSELDVLFRFEKTSQTAS